MRGQCKFLWIATAPLAPRDDERFNRIQYCTEIAGISGIRPAVHKRQGTKR
jgi:hypothetical protein